MAGKTDIRWSDGEWVALERAASRAGTSPGRWVKALVRGALALPAEVPEGRRSARSRPVGNAGSAVPVPPAGGGAPEAPAAGPVVPAGPAASPAVAPVSLERAVARALAARFGQRTDLRRMARQAIMRGEIRVDGVVRRDPQLLVDPGAVGG